MEAKKIDFVSKIEDQTIYDVFIHHNDNVKTNSNITHHIKTPYLLYVGSIEERKNLIFLLKSAPPISPFLRPNNPL